MRSILAPAHCQASPSRPGAGAHSSARCCNPPPQVTSQLPQGPTQALAFQDVAEAAWRVTATPARLSAFFSCIHTLFQGSNDSAMHLCAGLRRVFPHSRRQGYIAGSVSTPMGPTATTESAKGARHALSLLNMGASSCCFHWRATE